ncbi:MAG: inositol monophosphatase family protein [Kiloniellales bacterium]
MSGKSDDGLSARLDFAAALAREAGALALGLFKRRHELTVERKGLQDHATAADVAVEKLIRERLAARFPDDAFLGEESGASGLDGGETPTWVVDPIDGTACFMNGMASWCVSIALVREREIALGAIHDPTLGELFLARRGAGATLDGQRLPVPTAKSLRDGLIGAGFSHRSKPEEFSPFLDGLLKEGGLFIRNGSGALMLAYVAAGRLIGYFEPHINSWDSLAGLLLVREAGGWTNDFLANEGLTQGGRVVAAAPGVAEELRALIARTLD